MVEFLLGIDTYAGSVNEVGECFDANHVNDSMICNQEDTMGLHFAPLVQMEMLEWSMCCLGQEQS